MTEDRNHLLNYLVEDAEALLRRAIVSKQVTAAALIGEAQELLAIHAGIVRRRAANDEGQQLQLPLERKAA